MIRIAATLLSAVMLAPVSALAESMVSEAPANAEVNFVQPGDGDTVQSPVTVVFGLRNMGVAPAGTDKEGTGHHHLLIDTDVPSDLSKPLPATDQIMLSPGEHTLQLLLGNYAHVPHSDPVMSEKITITVE